MKVFIKVKKRKKEVDCKLWKALIMYMEGRNFFKHRFIPLEKVGHVKTTLPQMARCFFS